MKLVEVARKHLTSREFEILRLLQEERLPDEIAIALCISKRTVDRHLENLYRKLGAHSRVGAVNRAISAGLLAPITHLSRFS